MLRIVFQVQMGLAAERVNPEFDGGLHDYRCFQFLPGRRNHRMNARPNGGAFGKARKYTISKTLERSAYGFARQPNRFIVFSGDALCLNRWASGAFCESNA